MRESVSVTSSVLKETCAASRTTVHAFQKPTLVLTETRMVLSWLELEAYFVNDFN